jgi:hypothetical protein
MDVSTNVGGNDRRIRAALAMVFTVAAIRALRAGKAKRGLLLGAGALIAGFTASTRYCPVNDVAGIDTSGGGEVDIEIDDRETTDDAVPEDAVEVDVDEFDADDGEVAVATAGGGQRTVSERATLTCAFCGDPIVPGQSRGPNAQGDIVHDTCE